MKTQQNPSRETSRPYSLLVSHLSHPLKLISNARSLTNFSRPLRVAAPWMSSRTPVKLVVLSCTAQNLTCSQEFQRGVPPCSDKLRVSLAADAAVATLCPCPFQLWHVVPGTPAQVPPQLHRAHKPDNTRPLHLPRTSPSPSSVPGSLSHDSQNVSLQEKTSLLCALPICTLVQRI